MSKYIRLDEATDLFRGIDATMTGSFVADTLESLPTIEVSEDCISRDWVLNRLTKYQKDYALNELDDWQNTVVEWITTDIENAPSVVPSCQKNRQVGRAEGEWIPCSERMPENGHYYLWCSDMGGVQSDYYWDGFEKGQKYGYNIVAWMPLPEPWKGTDNE